MSRNADLLSEIEEARASLYTLVRAAPTEALVRRPSSGDWTVVENVRHLIYAEQLHLGRLLGGRFEWSAIGLPTGGRPKATGAGTRATDDMDEVLATWDAVHDTTRDAVRGREDAAPALERNLHHLRAHVRTLQRLLGDHDAPRRRT